MTPDEQRAILSDSDRLATSDIDTFWRYASRSGLDSSEFRDLVIHSVPEIIDPYAAAAGDLAATSYEITAPDLEYVATPAELAPIEQLEASTSWALRAAGDAAPGPQAAGPAPRAVPDRKDDAMQGSVCGYVVQAASQLPVAGAIVVASRIGPSGQAYPAWGEAPPDTWEGAPLDVSATALTDSAGRFWLEDLNEGSWLLRTRGAGGRCVREGNGLEAHGEPDMMLAP